MVHFLRGVPKGVYNPQTYEALKAIMQGDATKAVNAGECIRGLYGGVVDGLHVVWGGECNERARALSGC